MFEIINKNSYRPHLVEVVRPDGKKDFIQVQGPKRPVRLGKDFKPAKSAFANKDLLITEIPDPVEEETSTIEGEQQ